jgi:hypothetical protein
LKYAFDENVPYWKKVKILKIKKKRFFKQTEKIGKNDDKWKN